ncbi:caspase family protein [Candidatus Albibeggiatoa sp. nov. NOAA]|uniref:caspase family protein n=1 Tax=Candidatus Albibeggiatoa sp. nov. NOAA TaxID=3162724 RepID=UPI0032FA1280|nr:caspase family protein [Thiotrichaceae bacterium]
MSRQALIVGINNYDTFEPLTTPSRDAQDIAALLFERGKFSEIELLLGASKNFLIDDYPVKPKRLSSISEDDIKDAIENLLNPESEQLPDVALLYFSGHGFRHNDRKIINGYLASSDTDYSSENPKQTTVWGVSFDWLHQQLKLSDIQHKVVILDCCHAGQILSFSSNLHDTKNYFLAASSRDIKESYCLQGEPHSLFTSALLDALDPTHQATGTVTTSSLRNDVESKFTETPSQTALFFSPVKTLELTHCSPSEVNVSTSQLFPEFNLDAYFDYALDDFEAWKKIWVVDNQCKEFDESLFYAEETKWYVELESMLKGKSVDEDEERHGFVRDLRKMLIQQNDYQMLLLGVAGMGKTSSLQFMLYHDIQDFRNGDSDVIPVLLKLKEVNIKQNLIQWIINYFTQTISEQADEYTIKQVSQQVEQWLKTGRLCLYLDGWNEMPHNSSEEILAKNQLLEKITKFNTRYEQCFILVSCRQQDYRGEFSNIPTFILKNMDKQQTQQFIERNTLKNEPTRQHALQVIQDSKQARLQEFLTIPLYSLMFVKTLRKTKSVAKNIALLIQCFIKELLERESTKVIVADKSRFLHFLYRFAYLCVTERKNDNNTAVARIYIEEMLLDEAKSSKRFLHDEVGLFLEFAQQLNILVEKQNKYSFVHPDYQIYFAAEGKQYFAPDEPLDYQALHLYKLTRFKVGLSEVPHNEIQQVAKHNILLASLCFQDEFNPKPDTKTQLIEQAQKEIENKYYTLATLALLQLRETSYLGYLLGLTPKQQRVLTRRNNELTNEYVYNVLIHSADSFERAEQYFQEMQQHTPLQQYLVTSQIHYVVTYNVLINKAPYEKGIELFEQMQQNGLSVDEISYNTLINKAPYEKAIELFQEMQQKRLRLDVITFNTILKKANHSHQPFKVILDLLEHMLALRIKPQAKEGYNQKGRKMKPHTVYAVQAALRKPKNREQFRAWAEHKRRALQTQPRWLRDAWEQFFQKLE